MISLKLPVYIRNITLNYSSARDCFQYVLYEKYNIFRYNYNYDKIHSRTHQIAACKFFSWSSMLALAFSPHRGLVVKGWNIWTI